MAPRSCPWTLLAVLVGVFLCVSPALSALTSPLPLLRDCYECQPDEEHCQDETINLARMRMCTGRTCFKGKVLKDGIESVVRGCWQVEMEEACTKEILAGANSYTCHCTGEMCNMAPAPVSVLPLLLVAGTLCLFLG